MKPPRFAYHAPTGLQDALQLLDEHPDDAKILAGGQSLVPVLNFRLAAPAHLVDINRLPGLDVIERTQHGWRIPALVRQRAVEKHDGLARSVPLLRAALVNVAHPQIRNRGTVCGSLAHADASAELPAAMLALDATMTLSSTQGTRSVRAEDFFVFHMTTALGSHELLLHVELPDPIPGSRHAFLEFAPRKGDFCIAGVAASVVCADDGTVVESRVVAAGVGATALRLHGVEETIVGTALEEDALMRAQRAAAAEISPSGDNYADAGYRRQLASVLVRRTLAQIERQEARDAH